MVALSRGRAGAVRCPRISDSRMSRHGPQRELMIYTIGYQRLTSRRLEKIVGDLKPSSSTVAIGRFRSAPNSAATASPSSSAPGTSSAATS
jgi:hypothetical protein